MNTFERLGNMAIILTFLYIGVIFLIYTITQIFRYITNRDLANVMGNQCNSLNESSSAFRKLILTQSVIVGIISTALVYFIDYFMIGAIVALFLSGLVFHWLSKLFTDLHPTCQEQATIFNAIASMLVTAWAITMEEDKKKRQGY